MIVRPLYPFFINPLKIRVTFRPFSATEHVMKLHDDGPDDAALVARTLAGEREAFGPLLLRYYPSVLRLCGRLLGPASEAQDVAQEAALQAFLGLAQLHEPDRFGAWLHAIARVNPLTYEVEGLRGFLLGGGHPGLDLLVTLGWLIVLAAAATRAYPKAIL